MSELNPFLALDCPIEPLGSLVNGDGLIDPVIAVISASGYPVKLNVRNLGKNHLIHVCGGDDWLKAAFPQYAKPGLALEHGRWVPIEAPALIGFDQAEASRALITACCARGVVRQDGPCLLDAAGRLIWPREPERAAP